MNSDIRKYDYFVALRIVIDPGVTKTFKQIKEEIKEKSQEIILMMIQAIEEHHIKHRPGFILEEQVNEVKRKLEETKSKKT